MWCPLMQNDHQLSVPELEQKYRTSATKVSWGRERGGCREGEGEREKNIRKGQTGASLVVQWLRLCAPSARGMGLIAGRGTKIPHAAKCSQKKTRKGQTERDK